MALPLRPIHAFLHVDSWTGLRIGRSIGRGTRREGIRETRRQGGGGPCRDGSSQLVWLDGVLSGSIQLDIALLGALIGFVEVGVRNS